jgi:hypothetical protein
LFCLGILSNEPCDFRLHLSHDLSPKKTNNKLQHIDDVDVVKLTCHVTGSDRDSLGQRPLLPCAEILLMTRQSRAKRPPTKRIAVRNTVNAV